MFSHATVYEGSQRLHFNNGRIVGILQPGRYRFFGTNHHFVDVPMTEQFTDVAGQEVSTSDAGTFRVTLFVAWKVIDPRKCFENNLVSVLMGGMDDDHIRRMAKIVIRDWFAARTFLQAIEERDEFEEAVKTDLASRFADKGIAIAEVFILDMNPAGGLKSAMADLLKVEIEGRVALARARNEAATMRSLLNTARLCREHPGLMELRVLSSNSRPRVTFVVGSGAGTDAIGEVVEEETRSPE
ncbi:MAG: hypothetical protein JST35_05090 [Armatimonadetes bacterium]|nr:hypothetical protein [Armatimonadota bacterium]